MPLSNKKPQLSNCCKAEIKVITDTDLGRAGTSYYECQSCSKPCDPVQEDKPQWEEKLQELSCKYANDLAEFHRENTVSLKTEIIERELNQFISDLRQADKEEMIKMIKNKGLIHIGATGYIKVSVEDIINILESYYNKYV